LAGLAVGAASTIGVAERAYHVVITSLQYVAGCAILSSLMPGIFFSAA
jgi:hypothetical protein